MADDISGSPAPTRRTVLIATGATAAVALVAAGCTTDDSGGGTSADPRPSETTPPSTAQPSPSSSPSSTAPIVCTLTREMTEGPYHLEGALVRADISEDREGVPLRVALTVVDADSCVPLSGAMVELWHCDALGEYSGFVGANGHDGPDNGRFLRGGLRTDAQGAAEFTTVFPGWYGDRCVHIHIKVHTDVELTDDDSFEGGEELHTGQLFFPEDITEEVSALPVYAENTGSRTALDDDQFYDGGGATSGLLTLAPLGEGYRGSLTVGVQRGD
ncbi:intradiol ring-cleavage dioxygenase [Streptomyces sp. NPDC093252]|uniref:intradiol ring-cleavage dioxygenase n=1 Tax=Streptomyces sp. NPDC093252 TaxID=3154980 RepID=UPI00341A8FE0